MGGGEQEEEDGDVEGGEGVGREEHGVTNPSALLLRGAASSSSVRWVW